MLYLDSMYRDAEEKVNGEEIHRVTSNDFLKLPSSPWAQPFAREAASKNILPYEFTGNYSENITREQFCILLANLICVKENYSSLDKTSRILKITLSIVTTLTIPSTYFTHSAL